MKIFSYFYNTLLYILTWTIGSIIGWLPRFVWLFLSDILYVLLYKIFNYRVKVTRENLRLSFPEKNDKERLKIEHRFYLYLMDIFVETIVLAGISKHRIDRRMTFTDNEEFDAVCKERSVIVTMAHYASWEWPIIYAGKTESVLIPVYHTLASKWADRLFFRMRSRFGAKPVSMKVIGRRLVEMRGKKIILALIADQTPPKVEKTEWVTFLNQDTMFFSGPENLAKKYKMPVYFFDIKCLKRGYYTGRFVKLYDGDEDLPQYEITKRYMRFLEQKINEKPQFWIWSHKRWKHKRKN